MFHWPFYVCWYTRILRFSAYFIHAFNSTDVKVADNEKEDLLTNKSTSKPVPMTPMTPQTPSGRRKRHSKVKMLEVHFTGETGTKWHPFCRRYFEMHFLKKKFCILTQISLKFIPVGVIDKKKSPLLRAMACCHRKFFITQNIPK